MTDHLDPELLYMSALRQEQEERTLARSDTDDDDSETNERVNKALYGE